MIASDFNEVMRLVYVAYFHATTEVVLLLKLGGNEVFFRHKSAEEIYRFCTTYCYRLLIFRS
jgi:hypothetical protein